MNGNGNAPVGEGIGGTDESDVDGVGEAGSFFIFLDDDEELLSVSPEANDRF